MFATVGYLADAARAAGEVDDARRLIDGLAGLAASTPAPLLHAELAHARAVLANDAQASVLFERALRTDTTSLPLLRARTQYAYGSWLRRLRRNAEAREPLRSALDAFSLIGAVGWIERARAELRAAGERREAATADPGQVLSAHELRIARLAAAGHSNREIGEMLAQSPRTISAHLYRIYPKLHVTSRRQLAARLSAADR